MATETFTRLYVLNYNNYGNRIIKKLSTVNDYKLADPSYKAYSDINFYRGDGVNTTQTVNFAVGTAEKDGDYMLVVKVTKVDGVETTETIVSRWFIIECKYNRRNQLIFTLRRDLIVDFLDDIKDQPFYCEKGVLNSAGAALLPLICQPEPGMQFNQVLQSKTDLASGDANGIYGYIDRGYAGGRISANINTIYFAQMSDLPISDLIGKKVAGPITSGTVGARMVVNNNGSALTLAPGWVAKETITSATASTAADPYAIFGNIGSSVGTDLASSTDVKTNFHSLIGTAGLLPALWYDVYDSHDVTDYNRAYEYVGKHIMIGDRLYKVTLTSSGSYFPTVYPSEGTFSAFAQAVKQSTHFMWKLDDETAGLNTSFYMIYGYTEYSVALEDDNATGTFLLKSIDTRAHCGQPYDIFYMPDTATARTVASLISTRLYSSGALYDIQRLPYRPSSTGSNTQTITVGDNSVTLYWLSSDSFERTSTSYTKSYSGALNTKIGALCDTVRICSPNHANSWDINPAMNNGITGWTIKCTLKPFSPYIHIKPNFGGLYGTTYSTDPRGLICGGSFSMPLVSDKWANYQINNSAYANSFDRDIQNLSTIQDAQRTIQKWQIAAGVMQGASSGAYMGANLGGGVGAAVGGVAGGAGSLIAGIADYEMSEKLRNEAIDYRRDQFGFAMQNIIAAPRTLSRTNAFDSDWNGFAYVEYYSASSTEKEMLARKLKFNGMTLNVVADPSGSSVIIGGLKLFLNNTTDSSAFSQYVKGKLIRFGGKDDTHIFNEICNELYKGIYWQGGTIT